MQVTIWVPQELPQHNETNREDRLVLEWKELFKVFNTERTIGDKKDEVPHKIRFVWRLNEHWPITVNLSWECHIKAVTNWMTKHMLSYPETEWWFEVRFGDLDYWFKVMPCEKKTKGAIKIGGFYYKVYPYDFAEGKNIKKSSRKELYTKMMNKCA